MFILNSKKGLTEVPNEMVTSVMLQIEEHEERSDWAVTNLQYDIVLEMPRQKEHNSMNACKTGNVSFDNKKVPILKNHENEEIKVTNTCVKSFWSLLKNCNSKFGYHIYRIIAKPQNMTRMTEMKHSPRLEKLLLCYKEMFRDKLPFWKPPARGFDHKIVIEASQKLPQIPFSSFTSRASCNRNIYS